jgi:hypothetical protein
MTDRLRRLGVPEPLAPEVRAALARLGGQAPGRGMAEITAAWAEAVGEAIATNAWPARVTRDGTLVVHASSSTWAFELGHLEATIRARLGDLAPARIRFVVGPVPAPGREGVESLQRTLPRPGRAERARAAEIARCIEDPELREAAARAAAASLARGSQGGAGRPV